MTEKGNIALQSHGVGYLHNQSFEDNLSMENYCKELTHREGPLTSNKLQQKFNRNSAVLRGNKDLMKEKVINLSLRNSHPIILFLRRLLEK